MVHRAAEAALPTKYGNFRIIAYENDLDNLCHVAIVKGDVAGKKDVLVRVHSECLTGDAFGSLRCDCGDQLATALKMIEKEGLRCSCLHASGGPWYWLGQQNPCICIAGSGLGYCRG